MHAFIYLENVDLDSSGNLRPSPLALRGGVLLRSLQGKELHEVLAESDRALRVVKDMFGDDPMVRPTIDHVSVTIMYVYSWLYSMYMHIT